MLSYTWGYKKLGEIWSEASQYIPSLVHHENSECLSLKLINVGSVVGRVILLSFLVDVLSRISSNMTNFQIFSCEDGRHHGYPAAVLQRIWCRPKANATWLQITFLQIRLAWDSFASPTLGMLGCVAFASTNTGELLLEALHLIPLTCWDCQLNRVKVWNERFFFRTSFQLQQASDGNPSFPIVSNWLPHQTFWL